MKEITELVKESRNEREQWYENKFKEKVTAAIIKKDSLEAQLLAAEGKINCLRKEVTQAADEITKLGETTTADAKKQIDAENISNIGIFSWDWGKVCPSVAPEIESFA